MKNELLKRMPYLTGNPEAIVKMSPDGIPYNAAIPVSNRKMQLVIPTHKRSERQITLKELSPELQQEVLIITSLESDAKAIRKNYGNLLKNPKLQVISIQEYGGEEGLESVDGIAKKRQWIIENVGSESIFQLDCDQYFFRRAPKKYRFEDKGQLKLKPEYKDKVKLLGKVHLTADILTETFREFQRRMTDTKSKEFYVHTCLSSRMGNNQVTDSWKIIGRTMHSLGHRRDVLLKNNIRFDEIKLREDFNVTLRLLRLGYENAIYYETTCSPSTYGAAGGCSEERTIKTSNKQAMVLAEMHPGFVKVVDKEYEGTPRKEVIIAWKKAFDSASKSQVTKKKSLF